MKKMNRLMTKLYVRATGAWRSFQQEERGDTNFISILIIIAIVLVLAGLFMKFGNAIMGAVQEKVEGYISKLDPETSPV